MEEKNNVKRGRGVATENQRENEECRKERREDTEDRKGKDEGCTGGGKVKREGE